MIDGVTNADSLPVLERFMQFAGARHRLITHNIANLSTPDFRPTDVSPEGFQRQLGEAVDARRERSGNAGGDLEIQSTDEIEMHDGRLVLDPRPRGENILFHDGNDRDAEKIMQDLVENFMAFRTAAEFMRSRLDLMNTAIRERI